MATQPIQYNTYNPNSPYNYTNPGNIAKSQEESIASQGQQLYNQNNQLLNQAQQQQQGTQDYLGNIENPIAQGQGGYNAQEVSQIEMTPQQQQNIVTGAGISAGANTAAATDAAQRQFNATGGNPAAMAAYRQREAQQQGSQAAQALTGARIGAQQALSQETQNVGNARLGQQDQALGYYNQLQQEQNQNVQNAAERNQQTYGTASGAGNQAGQLGLQAASMPSTFDKTIGAISGFLEDGGEYLGHEAVVAEGNQPERIVSSNYAQQADQGQPSMAEDGDAGDSGWNDASGVPSTPMGGASQPWWQRMGTAIKNSIGTSPRGGSSTGNMTSVGMTGAMPIQSQSPMNGQGQSWNTTTPYRQIGQAAGNIVRGLFLEDGGVPDSFMEDGAYLQDGGRESIHPPTHLYGPGRSAGGGMRLSQVPQGTNGIFTKPTKVNLQPGDKVVPLTHRPYAKVRPSAAFGPSGVNG